MSESSSQSKEKKESQLNQEEDKNDSTSETTASGTQDSKKVIDKEFHEFMAELKKVTKEDNKFTQEY